MRRFRGSAIVGSVASLFFLSAPVSAGPMDRLDPAVHPTFQFVDLQIDPDATDYTGSVRIELQVIEPVDRFHLHADLRKIESLILRDADTVIESRFEIGAEGFVTVRTTRPLVPGPHSLAIDFAATYRTTYEGLFRIEQDGHGYLFTQFEATDARRAFPCWDEPAFKIPFQLRLRVPGGNRAITNTPEESRTVVDGWTAITFKKSPPMPTYLIAIAAGRLETVDIPGLSVPGRVVTLEGKSKLAGAAVAATAPILGALEAWFDIPYPYEKLDLIAIPSFPGAMENPGAITYGERFLLLDEATASVAQKRTLASIHAHELAHIWFGDLVTMEWWDDLWLNESFASWLGDKTVDRLYPEYRFALRESRSVQSLMSRDARPSTKKVRKEIVSNARIFEDLGLSYGKGQRVLEMIEAWIGADSFRNGVKKYLAAHTWGNASAADLWGALSEASGLDLGPAMSSFLDQPGLPLISVTPAANGGYRLRQTRFHNDQVTVAEQTWVLPVRLRYGSNQTSQTRTVVLAGPEQTIDLGGSVGWILPDDGAYGYYRWTVPAEMFRRLAEDSAHLLTPRERVSFLGNTAALLDAGTLSGPEYLGILNAFCDDPEPEVLSTVIAALSKVETAFVGDDLRGSFAAYVRTTLQPMLDRIGLESAAGEEASVSSLRATLIGWLGEQGRDADILSWATRQAHAYMEDPARIDAALAATVLELAALDGNRALFENYRNRFEKTEIPVERGRYLNALAAFEDPALQSRALDYSLAGPLRPTEILTVARALNGSDAVEDRLLGWVMEHYGELREKISPWRVPTLPNYAGGCSLERLETARTFFSEPDNQVDGTAGYLVKVTDQVRDCARLRQRDGAAVAEYLSTFTDQG